MSTQLPTQPTAQTISRAPARAAAAVGEPVWVRAVLIGLALTFLTLFLLVPLASVFAEALQGGQLAYAAALRDPDVQTSIRLTLATALVAVPLNVVFGVVAAWCIARFEFWGKNILLSLIDLPFAVSPVIAGLALVLVYGINSPLGGWLDARDIKIIFALPGIVLATLFVTVPFVARELIPLMQAQGSDEEQAAVTLGATGWQAFWRVTLPNIRWGLLYGVVLTNARAVGEFGAVSVVSGHIAGETNTMPLQIQQLYDDSNFVGAFAVASLLMLLALVTLVAKTLVEWRAKREGTQ